MRQGKILHEWKPYYFDDVLSDKEGEVYFTLIYDDSYYLRMVTKSSGQEDTILETPLSSCSTTGSAIEAAKVEISKAVLHFSLKPSKEEIEKPEIDFPKPMLAHLYEKHKHKVPYPCFVQPKLDGVRCIAQKINNKVICWSRNGNIFFTTEHIEADLKLIMAEGDVFDGELYVHSYRFNEIFSKVANKSQYKGASEIAYHIYDIVDPDLPQYQRFNRLIMELPDVIDSKFPNGSDYIRIVETRAAQSEEHIRAHVADFISGGYEGGIVRNAYAEYKLGSRTPHLLKVKKFQDEEFLVVGAFTGVGKDEGCVIWVCQTKDFKTFNVRPAQSYAERRIMWEEAPKYFGRYLTVKYFEKSEYGVPRFPIGIRFREKE